jgi:superfamily II DNA/RNA helicase
VAKIAEELSDRHFAVAAVHGDLGQGAREQALRAFRNGKIDVLVATDVAARGIDVEGVTHVVNFQCPEDEKVYTHRIGRTGRAGAKGTAVTFVDWDEVPRWQLINKALGLSFPEPAELYSTSPQLYQDLGIPEGVKGVLPRQERVRQGLEAEEIEDLGETGRGRAPRGGGRGPKEAPKQERPARAPRQRNRTRRGQQVGAPGDGAVSDVAETSPVKAAPSSTDRAAEPVATTEAALATDRAPRKRSRTRKSATAAGGGSVKLAPGSLAGPVELVREVQPAAPAESPIQQAVSEQAEPRKRTRTRKSAAAKVVADPAAIGSGAIESGAAGADSVDAAQTQGAGSAEATEPVAATPRKRTRARKSAAETVTAVEPATAAAAADEDADAGPVANPRRTRVRATRSRKSAAAEPVVETPQAEQ